MRIIPRKTSSISFNELMLTVKVLLSGQILSGSKIGEFEKKFSDYIGTQYALVVPSARAGVYVLFKSLGYSPGDEVIMSAYNFPAIPYLIKSMGMNPVFIDTDPQTFNIDCGKIEERISKRTKYIIVTHMYGRPCELSRIIDIADKYKLKVIEDCAHACGAEYKSRRVGSFGVAGYFSFGTGKNMVTLGGGVITTNYNDIFQKAKLEIKKFGMPSSFSTLIKVMNGFAVSIITKRVPFIVFVFPINLLLNMFNIDIEDAADYFANNVLSFKRDILAGSMRFTNIQAVIGIEQLKRIDMLNSVKIENSRKINIGLSSFNNLQVFPNNAEGYKHVYLCYPFKIEDIWDFKKFMIKKGIDIKISFQRDCPSMHGLSGMNSDCTVSRSIDKKIAELPNSYNLSARDMEYIIFNIKSYLKCIKTI
jgi:perosamine synthetase